MNRREFTKKISLLLLEMVNAGEQPIIDYVLRSSSEQNNLYQKGLSKCDGYKRLSYHQYGKAADIYLVKDDRPQYDWELAKSDKWHSRWAELGGKPLIIFTDDKGNKIADYPHFEG